MLTEPLTLPLCVLLKGLVWTVLLCLLHRHLHQSGALTMEALQDPAPDPMEGMEEDIADKVGSGLWPGGRGTGLAAGLTGVVLPPGADYILHQPSRRPAGVLRAPGLGVQGERSLVPRVCLWAHQCPGPGGRM